MDLLENKIVVLIVIPIIVAIISGVVLYKIGRKDNKKDKIKQLKLEAKQFLIDNVAERNFVPLCIFAAKYTEMESHQRTIYINFCKQSKDMQKLILEEYGIKTKIKLYDGWIDVCLKRLREAIFKFELTPDPEIDLWFDIYEEGLKYLPKAIEIYKNQEWLDLENCNYFTRIATVVDPNNPYARVGSCNFRQYISDYIDEKERRKHIDQRFRGQRYNRYSYPKPFGYFGNLNNPENPEYDSVACILELIHATTEVLAEKGLINETNPKPIPYEKITPRTYEDKYYQTLLALYNNYYSKK